MPAEVEGSTTRLLAVLVAVALLAGTVGLLEASPSATVRADGQCLRLRATPSTTATVITCLPDGTEVTPLDGHAQGDGHAWRLVETADGRTGWVAATFLTHSPIPGPGATAFPVPPPGGVTIGLAGTTSPALLAAAQPFTVATMTVLDVQTQRYLMYSPNVPAIVNTLTAATLQADDVVLIRRALIEGADSTVAADIHTPEPIAETGTGMPTVPLRVPSKGGMTHGIAQAGSLQGLIEAQPFAVEMILAWDVSAQRWLTYTPDVPAFVNTLRDDTFRAGMAVFMRRSATLPDPERVAPGQPGGLAAITYYYCTRGDDLRGIGDGGGFCGGMASGNTVYPGAASCSRTHFGQRFTIAGDPTGRVYTCEDTGGGVGGNHRDIWFADSDEGYQWRQQVGPWAEITILD